MLTSPCIPVIFWGVLANKGNASCHSLAAFQMFSTDPWVYQTTHAHTEESMTPQTPCTSPDRAEAPLRAFTMLLAALFTPSLPSSCTPTPGLLIPPSLAALHPHNLSLCLPGLCPTHPDPAQPPFPPGPTLLLPHIPLHPRLPSQSSAHTPRHPLTRISTSPWPWPSSPRAPSPAPLPTPYTPTTPVPLTPPF